MPQDAQEYLNKNYLLAKRATITKLNISNNNLTGELKLSGFSNLIALDCSNNQLIKLDLRDCPTLAQLHCSFNKITSLIINNCPQLKIIYCSNNSLIDLEITSVNVPLLEKLVFTDNQLTNLNFLTNLNAENLALLDINSNNLTGDLDLFSKFVNLWRLYLDDNFVTGSLTALQNYKQLKRLGISNTQINFGLEYLPESLERIHCEETKWEAELKDCKKEEYGLVYYDYLTWRNDHKYIINNAQRVIELEDSLANLKKSLENSRAQNPTINKALKIVSLRDIQYEINELKQDNQKYYENKIEIPSKN